jgi:DNA-binding NtrC family response regulator
MNRYLLISKSEGHLKNIDKVFSSMEKADFFYSATGEEALEKIKNNFFTLVVCDKSLPDYSGKDLIEKIIKINAMINTALVSTLSDNDFHEYTGGLGILKKIPENPSEKDAQELYDYLQKILHP